MASLPSGRRSRPRSGESLDSDGSARSSSSGTASPAYACNYHEGASSRPSSCGGGGAGSGLSFLGEDSLAGLLEHVSLQSASSARLPCRGMPAGGYYAGGGMSEPLSGVAARPHPIEGLPPMMPPTPPMVSPPSSTSRPTMNAATAAVPPDAPLAAEPLGVLVGSPCGQHLQVDILSTWGDPYYVGLSALEIFDEEGYPIELESAHLQARADPADINVLPEYGHDIRVIANLFDGTMRTCDDAHLWLAPFTPGRRNYIFVDLGTMHTLSMLRVWNYNKSRIHSFRGARHIEVRRHTRHLRVRGSHAPAGVQAHATLPLPQEGLAGPALALSHSPCLPPTGAP